MSASRAPARISLASPSVSPNRTWAVSRSARERSRQPGIASSPDTSTPRSRASSSSLVRRSRCRPPSSRRALMGVISTSMRASRASTASTASFTSGARPGSPRSSSARARRDSHAGRSTGSAPASLCYRSTLRRASMNASARSRCASAPSASTASRILHPPRQACDPTQQWRQEETIESDAWNRIKEHDRQHGVTETWSQVADASRRYSTQTGDSEMASLDESLSANLSRMRSFQERASLSLQVSESWSAQAAQLGSDVQAIERELGQPFFAWLSERKGTERRRRRIASPHRSARRRRRHAHRLAADRGRLGAAPRMRRNRDRPDHARRGARRPADRHEAGDRGGRRTGRLASRAMPAAARPPC